MNWFCGICIQGLSFCLVLLVFEDVVDDRRFVQSRSSILYISRLAPSRIARPALSICLTQELLFKGAMGIVGFIFFCRVQLRARNGQCVARGWSGLPHLQHRKPNSRIYFWSSPFRDAPGGHIQLHQWRTGSLSCRNASNNYANPLADRCRHRQIFIA